MPKSFRKGIQGVIAIIALISPLIAKAEYYTFQENEPATWQDPSQIISNLARTNVELLSWLSHSEDRPTADEKYNRAKHFGPWVDDAATADCYDTRALVLIRDSEVAVSFSPTSPCKVSTGQWTDPYSGTRMTSAREIEIDHVVALKNAYDSGAWAWDYQHRCLYANFMGYDHHLLSASSKENNAKSDKGPERWMPSDSSYACQHLQNWLVIKFIWSLNMTSEETTAIEAEAQNHGCSSKVFEFSKAEINRIRRFAQTHLSLCKDMNINYYHP